MSGHPFGVEAAAGRLYVSGEVDLVSAAQMLDAILSAGLTSDEPAVVVDLAGVTFLDSTGTGALVEAAKRLRSANVDLRVEAASPFVARTLEISGVGDFLGLPA
jgi:anti-sigma B factor antagonist